MTVTSCFLVYDILPHMISRTGASSDGKTTWKICGLFVASRSNALQIYDVYVSSRAIIIEETKKTHDEK
jgi:hypothetical protein